MQYPPIWKYKPVGLTWTRHSNQEEIHINEELEATQHDKKRT
ncbi:MAG: hypothetical protein AB7U40_00925 [Methanobacteriales archaeon]